MANTLAYYNTATITAVKSFIVQAPGFKLVALSAAEQKHASLVRILREYNLSLITDSQKSIKICILIYSLFFVSQIIT